MIARCNGECKELTEHDIYDDTAYCTQCDTPCDEPVPQADREYWSEVDADYDRDHR